MTSSPTTPTGTGWPSGSRTYTRAFGRASPNGTRSGGGSPGPRQWVAMIEASVGP